MSICLLTNHWEWAPYVRSCLHTVHFLQLQPVVVSVGWVRLIHSWFFSHIVTCVCLKFCYPPSKQFSSHIDRLFFAISVHIKKLTIAACYQCWVTYSVLFVLVTKNLLTSGNQKRVPSNQQQLPWCKYSNTYSATLVLIWFSSGSHLVLTCLNQNIMNSYVEKALLLRLVDTRVLVGRQKKTKKTLKIVMFNSRVYL